MLKCVLSCRDKKGGSVLCLGEGGDPGGSVPLPFQHVLHSLRHDILTNKYILVAGIDAYRASIKF